MKSFRGGVHPPDRKSLARERPIEDVTPPAVLSIPLSMHLGKPSEPAVAKGAEVRVGTPIGRASGFVSVPVHSPVSGKVRAVEIQADALGRRVLHVVLENDGRDLWAEGLNDPVAKAADEPAAIRQRILECGIVGLGGATFPSHVKLAPPANKPIDTAILNAAECEPYLACDERLMIERADDVLAGFRLAMKAAGAPRGIVGIEANKPEAARILSERARGLSDVRVEVLETKYPQGGERQLIYALLGRQVPSGGLPMDVGVVVHNVGTAFAIREAVSRNKPLVERVLTVSGEGVERPGNFRARIGTPVRLLLERAGLKKGVRRILLGGPMMGTATFRADLPVTKGTSGILALLDELPAGWSDCIRCGRCVGHCPQWLNPSWLSIVAENRREDLFPSLEFMDCVECGVCAYVCPARRPIVQFVKYAKETLRRQKARDDAAKAAKAAKAAEEAAKKAAPAVAAGEAKPQG